jgi:hypothetical protein
MTKPALVFLIISLLFGQIIFAKSNRVTFIDPMGRTWIRWILTEQQNQRTTILVVEDLAKETSQRAVTQVVVDKISMANATDKEIREKIKFYRQLKDLKNRTVDYYRNRDFGKLDKTPNPLWVPVKNEWSIDDEKNFSEWYRKNSSSEALSGLGLSFDCADYGILNRWIYAHDNKLPIANSLSGSGKLFGHFSESKIWSHLPTDADWKKDQRFKAAMRFLFDSTYTRSILGDLYPVKIDKEYVTPGTILLHLRSNNTGHTQVIHDVGMQVYCGAECITVLFGNEPARDIAYKSMASIKNETPTTGGILKWRWPQLKNGRWQLEEKKSMPGYSLDQYAHPELSYDEFNNYVMESLGFKVPAFKKAYSLSRSLAQDLVERTKNTALGTVYCHYQFCDPAGAVYDQYSTPSKDGRFREKRDQLLRLLSQLTFAEVEYLRSSFEYSLFQVEKSPSISEYIFNTKGISDIMSFDPSVSFADRWGIQNVDSFNSVALQTIAFSLVWGHRMLAVENAESTAEMDIGIKAMAVKVSETFSVLDNHQKSKIIKMANNLYLVTGCPQAPSNYCRATEYLFSGNNYIEKMTSDPAHSFNQRMGLE